MTGGAGFIGSNLIRWIIQETDHLVVNVDKLTYAGNLGSLADIEPDPRYEFEKLDITDLSSVESAFHAYQPDWVMNLAAESHVDRSIDGPDAFIQTNIVGTYNLLDSARRYWQGLSEARQQEFRFHHVSTDEVYGSLGNEDPAFSESNRYDPHSPYSASKASSDHLVRSWHDTYGLPTLITNCSNNYGPYQFPEKLIPVVILNAIHGKPIPVYGKGENVRDWLFVVDHVRALMKVVESGNIGETYNIGGNNELTNLVLVKKICSILDRVFPISSNAEFMVDRQSKLESYSELIQFVTDRPGHDLRYAIDASKIQSELGWVAEEGSDSGFEKTVRWYLERRDWWSKLISNQQTLARQGKL